MNLGHQLWQTQPTTKESLESLGIIQLFYMEIISKSALQHLSLSLHPGRPGGIHGQTKADLYSSQVPPPPQLWL